MRAREFIANEGIVGQALSAAQLASKTKAALSKATSSTTPSSTSNSTVPTQSASDLNTAQQQQRLSGLGNAANPDAQNQADKDKKPGFFGSLAKGFKQGIGVNPDQGLIRGLAAKGLDSAGMRSTADAMTDPVLKKGNGGSSQGSIGAGGAQPKIGSMINDPRFGNVKVLPNAPGQKGIHIDTTKTLGHPIYIDPADLR